jgi:hypothetical protein
MNLRMVPERHGMNIPLDIPLFIQNIYDNILQFE